MKYRATIIYDDETVVETGTMDGYFPIEIKLASSGALKIINAPEDLPMCELFYINRTNVEVVTERGDYLTPVQKLAIAIHDATCHSNHIDMCGWMYEIKQGYHDFSGQSHQTYLRKAEKLAAKVNDIASAIDLATIFKAYKESY